MNLREIARQLATKETTATEHVRATLAALDGLIGTPWENLVAARDDAVAELAAGLRRAGRPVPVFAVLLGSTPELGSLAGLRGMGDPAVAFLGPSAGPQVEEVLADAGWLCIPFAAGADPAEAWQRAALQQRAAVTHG